MPRDQASRLSTRSLPWGPLILHDVNFASTKSNEISRTTHQESAVYRQEKSFSRLMTAVSRRLEDGVWHPRMTLNHVDSTER